MLICEFIDSDNEILDVTYNDILQAINKNKCVVVKLDWEDEYKLYYLTTIKTNNEENLFVFKNDFNSDTINYLIFSSQSENDKLVLLDD